MGLRETKARRTRRHVVRVALELFIEQGFEQTTMEEIAERAEIGTSTLYRYFPSKDLLILDPLLVFTELGEHLRERPATEPLRVALGNAIRASLSGFADSGVTVEVRRIVDESASPRAKLWDYMAQSRKDLEEAIAARHDSPAPGIAIALTANMAFGVFELLAESWWAGDHARPISEVVDEMLAQVQGASIVMPGIDPA